MSLRHLSTFFLILLSATTLLHAKTVHYELTATKGKVNLSGNAEVDFALLLNGSIPAPVLEFTEGDDAEIVVKNEIPDDELSIHWHGILLDPYMDGVPYVNTPPIMPGQQYVFKFKIRQNGTYWYHSHTNVQEQKGVYGGILIHPKEKTIKYDKDLVLVLSDWTDENPTQVLKNLRKEGDYYLYKKGTMRSYWGAYKAGALKSYLYNEQTRMGGMDYSDVGYDAFLINGKKDSQALGFNPGDRVRIRVINAGASTYFNFSLGNVPMTVISADGKDIRPAQAKEVLIGMAETYDVLFTVPENKSFEFRSTAQDGTGSASLWIGSGEKIFARKKPMPDLYQKMYMGNLWETIKYTGSMVKSPMDMGSMDHSQMNMETMDHSKMDMSSQGNVKDEMGSMDHSKMDMGKMDHSKMGMDSMDQKKKENPRAVDAVNTLTANEIESPSETQFPETIKRHDVKLILDGDMSRYIWVINGKAINEDRTIIINENEVVRFTFENNSMMHHPMHLHGHFFRVLNKFKNKSPLKHTLDVPPHSTKTIEFYSNEPGEWMLHCHNLYHLKTGMARVVKYSSFTPNNEIKNLQKHDPHLHDHVYYKGQLEGSTNHAEGRLNLMNTWNELELRSEFRQDFGWKGEGDAFYKRWLSKYLNVIAGGTLVKSEGAAVAGLGYTLPFIVNTHTLIDQKGRVRVDLEKRFQWTKYIYTNADFTFRQKQDSEFEISLMYQKVWAWSGGLMFTERSVGAGLEYKF